MCVSWPDLEKPVKYSSEFLTNNKIKKKKEIKSNLKIWKANEIKEEIFLDYNSILSNEGFKNFLKNIHDYGFSVIKNCETNLKSVETIENRIGYVRNSIFGGLWSFESDENKADSAYTQDCLLYTSPSPRDRIASRMPSSA